MRRSGEQLRCVTGLGVQSPGGFARGGTVFRGLQPSGEARPASSRAKRGRPAERSEAPPRLRRAKRGRAKVIGRSPLQKNSKRFHQKAPGGTLLLSFLFYRGYLIKILFSKKKHISDFHLFRVVMSHVCHSSRVIGFNFG